MRCHQHWQSSLTSKGPPPCHQGCKVLQISFFLRVKQVSDQAFHGRHDLFLMPTPGKMHWTRLPFVQCFHWPNQSSRIHQPGWESYVTFTCHYIDPSTFKLVSVVLDTNGMKAAHTADNLEEIEQVIKKRNLKNTVCISDNAANITKACNQSELPHFGCFAQLQICCELLLTCSKCWEHDCQMCKNRLYIQKDFFLNLTFWKLLRRKAWINCRLFKM